MNGLTKEILLKDPKKLQQITAMPSGTVINLQYLQNGIKQTTAVTKS
jgi:hypothetical protein